MFIEYIVLHFKCCTASLLYLLYTTYISKTQIYIGDLLLKRFNNPVLQVFFNQLYAIYIRYRFKIQFLNHIHLVSKYIGPQKKTEQVINEMNQPSISDKL